ncbi:MAG: TatD family hydrolase [Bacteroidia bacterium]|nr:TatD family hydrolase [Bacteroidia bacterium]
MIPYVNIHTHHLSQKDGVFLYNNRFGFDTSYHTLSYFSIGIHPWDANQTINQIEFENLLSHTNCLAIGECGLDKNIGVEIEQQRLIFEYQLQLAIKLQKPLIIHCVKAYDELIEICKPYLHQVPCIIHGFQKHVAMANQLMKLGFYLSLSSRFFERLLIDNNQEELHFSNQLFLETDDHPQLTIESVYRLASIYFKMTEEEVKHNFFNNFTALFNEYGR